LPPHGKEEPPAARSDFLPLRKQLTPIIASSSRKAQRPKEMCHAAAELMGVDLAAHLYRRMRALGIANRGDRSAGS